MRSNKSIRTLLTAAAIFGGNAYSPALFADAVNLSREDGSTATAVPSTSAQSPTPTFVPFTEEASPPPPARSFVEFTGTTLDSQIKTGIVMVEFYSDATKPNHTILQEVIADTNDNVLVGRVNLSRVRGKSEQYGIKNVLTFIVYQDGTPVFTIVGLRPANLFVNVINSLLPSGKQKKRSETPSVPAETREAPAPRSETM